MRVDTCSLWPISSRPSAVIGPAAQCRSVAVSPELLQLLDAWSATPAMILTPTLDVLARNALARGLYSGFSDDDNLLRMTFLDPEGRRIYVDWDRAAEASVANLRAASVIDPDDPALV